jgi:quinol monooxygenase YgiN
MLASPFDARLYDEPRDGQWPTAQNGDFVVLTQVELHSEHVRAGSELLHAYVDAQTSQVGLVGQALLQRLHRVGLFEVISVWEAQELFDEFLNSSVGQGLRLSLDPVLSTPLEDRRHQMIIGEWSVSTSE